MKRRLRYTPNLLVLIVTTIVVVAQVAQPFNAVAALTYTVESGGWPNANHRDAAVATIQSSVDRYNAYSPNGFGNYNVYVYYNAGIPTAQASYLGSIGFGGTYPNERVMLHELAHYLGSGTYGDPWNGEHGEALVDKFDGLEADLQGDANHFWPYGLNYDSEGSEINKQRQVAMVYAQRADMGIGPVAHPSNAKIVPLDGNDPFGESSFNYKSRWRDGYFPHAGADYFTGQFQMRTPESANSFRFGGDSLTLNSPTSSTGLLFKGLGSNGIIKFDQLNLNGGWITHGSSNGLADLFQLDGNLNILSNSNFRANNGDIDILADVHGEGALVIHPTQAPAEENRYVRFLSAENTFVGNVVINNSRFELAAGSNFHFKVSSLGVNNAITGVTARRSLLNGVFEIDLSGAEYTSGNEWQLVSAANSTYGPTFDIPGFHSDGDVWTNGSYTFDQATGVLSATPRGDLNSDGEVNLTDWLTFVDNHLSDLSGFTPEQRATLGDLDSDGDNDFADFRQFEFQYDALNGAGAFAAMLGTAVPEPSSLTILAMGSGLLVISRRRRVHSKHYRARSNSRMAPGARQLAVQPLAHPLPLEM